MNNRNRATRGEIKREISGYWTRGISTECCLDEKGVNMLMYNSTRCVVLAPARAMAQVGTKVKAKQKGII